MLYARMPAIFLGVLFACTAQMRPQTPDTVSIMSKIEVPQIPDRGGYDSYSLREMMDCLGVRAVSIAVVKDFKIHWTKAYGIADVSTATDRHDAQRIRPTTSSGA